MKDAFYCDMSKTDLIDLFGDLVGAEPTSERIEKFYRIIEGIYHALTQIKIITNTDPTEDAIQKNRDDLSAQLTTLFAMLSMLMQIYSPFLKLVHSKNMIIPRDAVSDKLIEKMQEVSKSGKMIKVNEYLSFAVEESD